MSCIQANYSPSGTLGYDMARDTMFANIDTSSSGEMEGVYSGFDHTYAERSTHVGHLLEGRKHRASLSSVQLFGRTSD